MGVRFTVTRSFVLRSIVTVGVLAALFVWLDPGPLLEAMGQTGLWLWVGIVLATFGSHFITASKWRMLLRATGLTAGWLEVLSAHCGGLFANAWLPSIVGGDVVRAGMVHGEKRGLGAVTASVIADRFTDGSGLLAVAVLGAVATPAVLLGPAKSILWITGGLLGLGVLGTAMTVRYLSFTNIQGRLGKALRKLHAAAERLIGRGDILAGAIVIAMAVQGFFVFLNVLVADALGIDLPPAVWFAVWPLAKMAAFLPISLGGMGVREVALVALLAPLGVDPILAVAHSLVWETVLVSVGLLGGAFAFTVRRKTGGQQPVADENSVAADRLGISSDG